MNLPTELYSSQCARWPSEGEHILAHHDDETIVVYQAYRPSIGNYAIEYGRFGGSDFSLQRMSWIKPNFLWMMYRSGWGAKEGQEVILGLRIRRAFFDNILAQAVASTYQPDRHASRDAWKVAVDASDVRLQWDPDHDPQGAKLPRRAVQLGLRGHALEAFAGSELLEVIDMTPFVSEQRPFALAGDARLRTPTEGIYLPDQPSRLLVVNPKK
ncbi:MAG: DUF4291 domain-containing protein [Leptothrix sp. (in: Bacteria)]|nr:DUF4291 domain-containing protein [Leptothrix sp. (in: b-proteobacteria)]